MKFSRTGVPSCEPLSRRSDDYTEQTASARQGPDPHLCLLGRPVFSSGYLLFSPLPNPTPRRARAILNCPAASSGIHRLIARWALCWVLLAVVRRTRRSCARCGSAAAAPATHVALRMATPSSAGSPGPAPPSLLALVYIAPFHASILISYGYDSQLLGYVSRSPTGFRFFFLRRGSGFVGSWVG
jgi:hypothetical protein